jgi:hypothetical protein
MNSTDRFRILSNIVAQKGTDQVDLYAELAKAESQINQVQTMQEMALQNPAPVTSPETPESTISPEMGQTPTNANNAQVGSIMGKYDNL